MNTSNGIFIHGHRGSRGWRTENCIEGFCFAIEHGAHFIEMDVVLTHDEEILVSHEPWMNSQICTHPDGTLIPEEEERQLNIFQMSLRQAQSYHLGEIKQERFPNQKKGITFKPSFAEVIREVQRVALHFPHFVGFNVEIKSRQEWDNVYHPEPLEYARLILRRLHELKHPFECILQTFDYRLLEALHRLKCPHPLVALAETEEECAFVLDMISFPPWGIGPHFSMIDPHIVNECESRKLELLVWTVNEEEDINRLIDLGVRHIISDFPDKVAENISRRSNSR
ncbi:MAG: glycerophosphodiester phosphodiesterase family protein [Flavobacteriales bacterium]|nr:glycerophosphodiester phosphodiesterase family protein [Flavobacteriales bacterium]